MMDQITAGAPSLAELQRDPETAWSLSADLKPVPLDEARHRSGHTVLVKRQSRVALFLSAVQEDGHRYIYKIYWVPGGLRWRTPLMVSRANREFTALAMAYKAGLRVVKPVRWRDVRHSGVLVCSTLSVRYVPGFSIAHLLKNTATPDERRRNLGDAAGVLLRQLHQGGLYWASSYPRNFLVPEDGGELMALDTPYAEWHGRDLSGSLYAAQDLEQLLWNGFGEWGFTTKEHEAILGGYCKAEPELLGATRVLAARQRGWQRKWKRARTRAASVLHRPSHMAGGGGGFDSG